MIEMADLLGGNRPNNTPAAAVESHFFRDGIETVFIVCLYSAMSIVATFGNLLVITAVYRDSILRSYKSNYFLANLAVADLFQGAISMPLRILEIVRVNYDFSLLCRIAIPTSILFGSSSNFAIVIISIDRFIAIYYPYNHLRYTNAKFIFAVIALQWTVSCFFGVLSATRPVWLAAEVSTSLCRFPVYLDSEYILVMFVIVHGIPIGTVVLLYGFILKASLRQAQRIHAQRLAIVVVTANSSNLNDDGTTRSTNTRRRNRRWEVVRQRKGAKTVSILVGLFILLVVPIIAIDLAEILGAPPAPVLLTKISVGMIYANNCVNVLVYGGFNRDYRRAFNAIFRTSIQYFAKIVLRN